jgi:beta-galactosidase
MIHIIPHHWNWKEGQQLDIHVVSNCEEVELFVNEKSLGRITPFYGSNILAERYRFIWHDVTWEPGTVRAVGYRKNTACTEEVLHTASTPAKLLLETQRMTCAADGEDMLFVTVSVTDKDGNLCISSRPFVKFSLQGETLKLMAADGGDPTSFEPFPTPECTLFSGQAVVYLQSTGSAGTTVLRAESDGLESAEIELKTL